MDKIYKYFVEGFKNSFQAKRKSRPRIGAELKFPLVNHDGTAASFDTICKLWSYLEKQGWKPVKDTFTGNVVGARKPGEKNDTVASCETGFCKTEFSLAHVANLFELDRSISELCEVLRPFTEKEHVYFLGYGIQPVTPPSKYLLMKKGRSSIFDRLFRSNRYISPKDGSDIHLFTINSASHVHIDVPLDKVIPSINVLNGFSGAQIALTANSNIWKGNIDPQYKCVNEKFWDWWMVDKSRVGMPEAPFKNLKDYIYTIFSFPPIYVRRNGKPIIISRYHTFEDYYRRSRAVGLDPEGKEISLTPEESDIDLHSTFYWYNTRISRYYTVENRVNDQQPPESLVCVAALTLGLLTVLPEASEEIFSYDWRTLHFLRESACRWALTGSVGYISLSTIAQRMLNLAELGLQRRGLGEEEFLHPLTKRLNLRKCPADDAEQLFRKGGIETLLNARKLES
jgi:glutamate--cysteine ligase